MPVRILRNMVVGACLYSAGSIAAHADDLVHHCVVSAGGEPLTAGDAGGLPEIIAVAEASLEAIPDTVADPLAVASGTDFTPEALRSWVAGHTVLRAYRGTLRGATGVLADRQGNSLDRSLLLAELLTFAGFDVRLARGTLPASDVDRLRERLGRTAGFPEQPEDDIPEITDAAAAAGAVEILCELETQYRIDSQTEALMALIGGDIDMAAADGLVRESLADHWWVQYRAATDWVDLDPEDLAAQAEWTGPVDALPDDLMHKVTFRVILEVERGDAFEEREALALVRSASEFAGAPLLLRFVPQEVPDLASLDQLDAFEAALVANTEWAPVLVHGTTTWQGDVFDLSGTLRPFVAGPGAGAAGLGTTAGGLLGGLGGGGEPEVGRITAIWIEVLIDVPGRGRQVERRALVDLRGAAARLAGTAAAAGGDGDAALRRALSSTMDFYVTSADPAPAMLPRHALPELLALLAFLEAFPAMLREAPETGIVGAARELPISSPIVLYNFLLQRVAVHRGATAPLYDQPNVIAFRAAPGEAAGTASASIDIIRSDPGIEHGLAEAIRLGVVDTVLEDLVLGGGGGPPVNTADIFAASLDKEDPWGVLRGPDDLARFDLPADAEALISASLARGDIVVAPFAPVDVGGVTAVAWWRIDPMTGATLGMSRTGAGQGTTEYLLNVGSIALSAFAMLECFRNVEAYIEADTEEAAKAAATKAAQCFAVTVVGAGIPIAQLAKLNRIRRINFSSGMAADLYGSYRRLGALRASGQSRRLTQAQNAFMDIMEQAYRLQPGWAGATSKTVNLFMDAAALGFARSYLVNLWGGD